MGIATCTNEIMTAGVKMCFKIRNDKEMTYKIGNDVDALPHSGKGCLVSGNCHVGAMDEVVVTSMSCPKQLCVRYKSSVITKHV